MSPTAQMNFILSSSFKKMALIYQISNNIQEFNIRKISIKSSHQQRKTQARLPAEGVRSLWILCKELTVASPNGLSHNTGKACWCFPVALMLSSDLCPIYVHYRAPHLQSFTILICSHTKKHKTLLFKDRGKEMHIKSIYFNTDLLLNNLR